MRSCTETQTCLTGEGAYRHLCGRVTVSPFLCGSVIQIHVRCIPCRCAFLGFCLEICGRKYPLPELLVTRGEALLSVYTSAFTPKDTAGAQVILTGDPCSPECGTVVARGCLAPCFTPGCCPPDPRPLFAGPIRW